nr:hypothetical protein [Tanacetum cinerariifolium]
LIPFGTAISNGAKGKRSISSVLNVEDDEPPLDFSHLEIPKMDVLGDAIDEQSWDVGYEVTQMLHFVLISQSGKE